jgi:hypothetical protein
VRTASRRAHWENIFRTKGESEVSWFEENPTISLDLIRACGPTLDASIIATLAAAHRGSSTPWWLKAIGR